MMHQLEPIISVKNLEKHFIYWPERPNNLKSFLIEAMKGKAFKRNHTTISVLDGVSFDIMPGEFVGIMGRNGVGKSTLMRLITGIYEPSAGSIDVKGRIAPLIALGAGFNPELSGYENISLNAAILGFGKYKTEEALQSIIDFSELEEKIHMPIKNYSSGMTVRLGFSIAAHMDSEILLLDEVLGVGDEGFKKKSMDKIFEMHNAGKTIILVSHAPDTVRQHCTRAIVLDKGKKIFDGSQVEGSDLYKSLFSASKKK